MSNTALRIDLHYRPAGYRVPIVVALLLVSAVSLWSRLPAPWRLGVINDEMHHLQSWRNRYGTNDIYPLFLARLHETHVVSGSKLQLLENVYHRSTLFQHGLLILADPQPPLFPALGELLATVTRSNRVALRMPSMLASLLSIYLMFRIGQTLRDVSLGGWLAALLAVTQLARVYAGIGRPYALAQCAVIATVLAYLLDRERQYASPWRFLLCALWAQATQWPAWLVISPMVLAVLCTRLVGGEKLSKLVRQSWWYVLLSFCLLGELFVQLHNPTIDRMTGFLGLHVLLRFIAMGAPLSDFGSFGEGPLMAVGYTVAAAGVVGLFVLLFSRDAVRGPLRQARYVIALVGATSVLGMCVAGGLLRFMNTYELAIVLLTGIALRQVFAAEGASAIGISVLAGVGGWVGFFHPQSAFDNVVPDEQSYAMAARSLARQLKPGDAWAAYPYFRADDLYPNATLPEPMISDRFADIDRFIEGRRKTGTCYLYVVAPAPGELPSAVPISQEDFTGHGILLKYGPGSPN